MAPPAACAEWDVLGQLLYSTIAIDPPTGRIYEFPEGEESYLPLNGDISSFVHALIVLKEGERDFKGVKDDSARSAAVERMKQDIRGVDETPFADEETVWSRLFDEISLGMWG
ncbi:SUKH-4 family immunity protein [Streptomyces sp. NBC_01003]|uniref:SUKH-4 family immunity protein n=1 Tax=Streptomyces sp. NBC_01003 TaxID=2903714 RepID=UPI00386CF3C0|nr:SUKH-4 family immunity protein [Streptomyces sp. NBC_01003]